MQAVGSQLIRGDVGAQLACGRALGQQFLDEVRQQTTGLVDVRAPSRWPGGSIPATTPRRGVIRAVASVPR